MIFLVRVSRSFVLRQDTFRLMTAGRTRAVAL